MIRAHTFTWAMATTATTIMAATNVILIKASLALASLALAIRRLGDQPRLPPVTMIVMQSTLRSLVPLS